MIQVRRATTEADAQEIRKLLIRLMKPRLWVPFDEAIAFQEVRRVMASEFAMIASENGQVTATAGIVAARFWWNPSIRFLAARWLVSVPGSKALMPLMRTAVRCAKAMGVELQIYDEHRGRLMVFNRKMTDGI